MSLIERLSKKYEDTWLTRTRGIENKPKEAQVLYNAPQSVQEQLEIEGINWPYVMKFTSGQIDSSSVADTVVLTGDTNKMFLVTKVTAVSAGTAPTFGLEMDTGSSFGTTRLLTAQATDNLNDGGGWVLHSSERLVIKIGTAQAGSTVDFTVSYYDMGFGTVWSQS